MNILQVFNSRIQKHGSFEDFMIELADNAQRNHDHVNFVFPRINTDEVKQEIEKRGSYIYIIENQWSSLNFIKKLITIIKKEKPTIADFHFCYSFNFTILFILLKLFRIKVIYHYHGEIKPIEELRWVNRHLSKLRLQTFFVDKIICVSQANKRYLEALNIKKKIDVVYNGVNTRNFANVTNKGNFRQEAGFNNGELIVSYIASLIPRKGTDILVKAAKQILKEVPQARFVFIGGGDKDKYETLAKTLGIADKIIFTGLLKDYPYYIMQDTDLYVSASYAESFGLSIAEAQLIGKPVVATRVGGVPEVVDEGRTGILVSAGDSDGLARAIIYLLKNKTKREKFGEAGKKWVSERFDLKEKVEEFISVCRS